MTSEKSIFIVVNSFGRGGAEMSLAVLARMLSEKGYKVSYIALWEEESAYDFLWLKQAGVDVVVLKGNKRMFFSKAKQMFKLCKAQQPFFVYTAMLKSDFLMSIICVLLSIPHLVSVRINPAQFYNSNLKKLFFASFLLTKKNILFISKKAIEEYRLTFLGSFFRKKKIYILHNPIETDLNVNSAFLTTKFTELKRRLLTKNELINMVMVSRIVEGKGILETLNTIKGELRNSRFHLKIFGVGPLAKDVTDFIEMEGLSDNVTYKGFNSDKFEIFSLSDILIFSSENEGFGRVPFESMIYGCLVLCNKKASILNEFFDETDCWQDYDFPLELYNRIAKFGEMNISESVKDVIVLQNLLSPELHVNNFIKIMLSCTNESNNAISNRY
ncbi:MAG: glycosyltransferase [Bacteroidetes bacterium]|nr:glycosyltransferase [Bacteroidota bacterium]